MKKKIFILILLFSITLLTALDLTHEEKIWIKNHPIIELGIGESWAPFIIPKPSGDHEGFDVDLLNLINEKLGTNIILVPGNWNMIVQSAKDREIDGLAESTISGNRADYFNFTDVYVNQYYALATSPQMKDKLKNKDLSELRISFLKGNAWVNSMMDDLGVVNRIEIDNEIEAYKLVVEGKADACFTAMGIYSEMRKIFHDNITIYRVFVEDKYKLDIVYSIRKDWPELVILFNKALAEITMQQKNRLFEKWVGVNLDEYDRWDKLTIVEQNWLEDHSILRIAPDPYFPPIEYFDEHDNYTGIASEYMALIEKQLGTKFQVVKCKSWKEVLQKAKNREVDILPAAAQTPERAEYMHFSDQYLEFPGVIITTKKNDHLKDTQALYGKKVGIVEDYVWHEMISHDHHQIIIHAEENITSGLRNVSTGLTDAFIVTLPIAVYYIEKEGISNLTVAGEIEYTTKLSILTRSDWPILNSIIKKALRNISNSEKERINREWVKIQKNSLIDNPVFLYSFLVISLLVVLTIIIISVINRTLRRRVKDRTKQLEDSRTTYLNLFQNAQVGMFRINVENGKMIDFNDRILQMLKYDNKEELQSDFVVSENLVDKNNWEHIKETMFSKHQINNLKARFKRKDGAEIWVKLSAKINKKDNWVEGVAEDITEQHKAETELQKLRANLEKKVIEQTKELQKKVETLAESEMAMLYMVEDLNKVSTDLKGERSHLKQANKDLEAFSYSVSHDLRAPLRAISGFIRILLEDYGKNLDDEGRRLAEIISDNAKKMGKLIDDLLTFSRLGKKAMNLTRVDMKTMVNSIYHEVTDAQERKQIEFKIADIPDITADTSMLRSVWTNLISNAVKFTAKKEKRVIKVEADANDKLITYMIKDNGVGFEPEFKDNLFKVFHRLHSEKEFSGTGVGLALVKRIIERHNGRVAANSKPGKGASFYFSLPNL